jgi:hypothetical protein
MDDKGKKIKGERERGRYKLRGEKIVKRLLSYFRVIL